MNGSTCVWFEEGEPLAVQFVRAEGTYSFHTTVMAVQKVPTVDTNSDNPNNKVLLFRKPRSIKFNDRRLVPRATVPPLSKSCTVEVTGLPGFSVNKISGYIRNLSSGGCSVQLDSFIPEKLVVILKLKLGETDTSISAVCHHITPPDTIDGSWFFGLRFTKNSKEDQAAIRKEIAEYTP
jgi:hypothetical protein